MRSAFIIASLAFTVLAAPVPTYEVDLLARRDPAEVTINKRYIRGKDGSTSYRRDTLTQEAEMEKRGGARNSYRSVEEDEVEKRFNRLTHPRSEDNTEAEVEKRQVRDNYKRGGARNNYRSVDETEAEVEKRGGARNNYRSVDDESEAEVEKRGGARNNYKRGGARNNYRSVDETEAEVEKRGGARNNYRSVDETEAEAEVEKRGGARNNYKRGGARNNYRSVDDETDAEVEKRGGARNNYRSVGDETEAEVEKRGGARNNYRSMEEAEEKRGLRLNQRSGDDEKRGVYRNIARSVYDGVVEMIEALKTRGFNSAANVPAREPM